MRVSGSGGEKLKNFGVRRKENLIRRKNLGLFFGAQCVW